MLENSSFPSGAYMDTPISKLTLRTPAPDASNEHPVSWAAQAPYWHDDHPSGLGAYSEDEASSEEVEEEEGMRRILLVSAVDTMLAGAVSLTRIREVINAHPECRTVDGVVELVCSMSEAGAAAESPPPQATPLTCADVHRSLARQPAVSEDDLLALVSSGEFFDLPAAEQARLQHLLESGGSDGPSPARSDVQSCDSAAENASSGSDPALHLFMQSADFRRMARMMGSPEFFAEMEGEVVRGGKPTASAGAGAAAVSVQPSRSTLPCVHKQQQHAQAHLQCVRTDSHICCAAAGDRTRLDEEKEKEEKEDALVSTAFSRLQRYLDARGKAGTVGSNLGGDADVQREGGAALESGGASVHGHAGGHGGPGPHGKGKGEGEELAVDKLRLSVQARHMPVYAPLPATCHPISVPRALMPATCDLVPAPSAPCAPAPALAPAEVELTCPVCFCDHAVSDLYTMDCPHSHRFCFDCLRLYVTMCLDDRKPVTCPHPEQSCTHELTLGEMGQLFPGDADVLARFDQHMLLLSLRSMDNAVACPNGECKNWVITNGSGVKSRCSCDACGHVFCSLCCEPYHFDFGALSCEAVRKIRERWEQFCLGSSKVKKVDPEKILRIAELLEDERYKEANCRHCPHCNKLVERIHGCDAMLCGNDAHGTNNKQDGCGLNFDWSTAAQYVSSKSAIEHMYSTSFADLLGKELCLCLPDCISAEELQCEQCDTYQPCRMLMCLQCEESCILCEACALSGKHAARHVFQPIMRAEPEGAAAGAADYKNVPEVREAHRLLELRAAERAERAAERPAPLIISLPSPPRRKPSRLRRILRVLKLRR